MLENSIRYNIFVVPNLSLSFIYGLGFKTQLWRDTISMCNIVYSRTDYDTSLEFLDHIGQYPLIP